MNDLIRAILVGVGFVACIWCIFAFCAAVLWLSHTVAHAITDEYAGPVMFAIAASALLGSSVTFVHFTMGDD
jgi:hypothetical protein